MKTTRTNFNVTSASFRNGVKIGNFVFTLTNVRFYVLAMREIILAILTSSLAVSKKYIFRPFGPQFGLKIRRGAGPPAPLPWTRHWNSNRRQNELSHFALNGLVDVFRTSKGQKIVFPPPSSPCNVVPQFELPLEWRGQGRGVDSYVSEVNLFEYNVWTILLPIVTCKNSQSLLAPRR